MVLEMLITFGTYPIYKGGGGRTTTSELGLFILQTRHLQWDLFIIFISSFPFYLFQFNWTGFRFINEEKKKSRTD